MPSEFLKNSLGGEPKGNGGKEKKKNLNWLEHQKILGKKFSRVIFGVCNKLFVGLGLYNFILFWSTEPYSWSADKIIERVRVCVSFNKENRIKEMWACVREKRREENRIERERESRRVIKGVGAIFV